MTPAKQELIRYRLNRARDALEEAKILLREDKISGAMSRTYYAMFYATLALLATRDLGSSRHSGVIALFRREFVKTGIFPPELAKSLDLAFDERIEADYRDFVVPNRDDLRALLDAAEVFITRAEAIVAGEGQ
jgi:uncharacterized protein (UPF0332 family)